MEQHPEDNLLKMEQQLEDNLNLLTMEQQQVDKISLLKLTVQLEQLEIINLMVLIWVAPQVNFLQKQVAKLQMLIYSALMVALLQEMVALSVLSSALMVKLFPIKMDNALLLPESVLMVVSLQQLAVQLLVQMALNQEPQDVLLLYNHARMDLNQLPMVVLKNAQEV